MQTSLVMVFRTVVVLTFFAGALFGRADTYNLVLGPPNGLRVPRIMGASGEVANSNQFTAGDYLEWFGITHNRFWFKPGFQIMNPTGGVTDRASFDAAVAAIRADPWRQGTAGDAFIDWNWFRSKLTGPLGNNLNVMRRLRIELMINDTDVLSLTAPLTTWPLKFKYWRQWYANAYYFSSEHDVSMYEFRNEPNQNSGPTVYDTWESHWLVAADAIRKAVADVNRNYSKKLKPNICGPTMPGPYWNTRLPPPSLDPHSWGSYSWKKVQTDLAGNLDPKLWNYGMYDFHRYQINGAANQSEISNLRHSIATAPNAPNSTIPLVITEYNTGTGSYFTKAGLDTENLNHGIGMAQILQATSSLGPSGLGDEGGLFVFRLTGASSGLLHNKLTYMSTLGDQNLGGISRGGVSFQLYARHFRGGKPLLKTTVTAGDGPKLRPVAVSDAEHQAYYVYFSNVSGVGATTTVDCHALDVEVGTPVTVARVDSTNTGQITDLYHLDAGKKITFATPSPQAWLMWIPQKRAAATVISRPPSHDTYLEVGQPPANHGAEGALKISLHHSTVAERRLGFLQFDLTGLKGGTRFLLRYSGRNIGTSQTSREILHVYGRPGAGWTESGLTWATAPGVGRYYTSFLDGAMSPTTGAGAMVDIEDNYAGTTKGLGLGVYGKFLGPISFASATYATGYIDVTDYVQSLLAANETSVNFIFARPVRYNVTQFNATPDYSQGVYDCDGRVVEIGAKENATSSLRPALIVYQTDRAR